MYSFPFPVCCLKFSLMNNYFDTFKTFRRCLLNWPFLKFAKNKMEHASFLSHLTLQSLEEVCYKEDNVVIALNIDVPHNCGFL